MEKLCLIKPWELQIIHQGLGKENGRMPDENIRRVADCPPGGPRADRDFSEYREEHPGERVKAPHSCAIFVPSNNRFEHERGCPRGEYRPDNSDR